MIAARPPGMENDHTVPITGRDRATGKRNVWGLDAAWNIEHLTPYKNDTKWAWFDCASGILERQCYENFATKELAERAIEAIKTGNFDPPLVTGYRRSKRLDAEDAQKATARHMETSQKAQGSRPCAKCRTPDGEPPLPCDGSCSTRANRGRR